jgi:hypothetical protein
MTDAILAMQCHHDIVRPFFYPEIFGKKPKTKLAAPQRGTTMFNGLFRARKPPIFWASKDLAPEILT